MEVIETSLKGAFFVKLEKLEDFRGFFERVYCFNEFKKIGINKTILQINSSYSSKKGTIRGLHYQVEPCAEIKIMRCIQGEVFDVIIDLRPESKTYCQWFGTKLTAKDSTLLVIPEGFAHGCQSLVDDTGIMYPVTACYSPKHERGIRWNDPLFNIEWPVLDPIVSDKDKSFPDFKI